MNFKISKYNLIIQLKSSLLKIFSKIKQKYLKILAQSFILAFLKRPEKLNICFYLFQVFLLWWRSCDLELLLSDVFPEKNHCCFTLLWNCEKILLILDSHFEFGLKWNTRCCKITHFCSYSQTNLFPWELSRIVPKISRCNFIWSLWGIFECFLTNKDCKTLTSRTARKVILFHGHVMNSLGFTSLKIDWGPFRRVLDRNGQQLLFRKLESSYDYQHINVNYLLSGIPHWWPINVQLVRSHMQTYKSLAQIINLPHVHLYICRDLSQLRIKT